MTYSVWGSFGSTVPTRDVFATETFAILRALTPPPSTLNTSIEVDGGVAKGDGLGGIFYYDPVSVLADDAVNTIAPTPVPTAGRWRRLLINVGFAVVTGGVVFGAGNVLAQDAANFFWDNVNKRLGIGNAAPASVLDVTGTVRSIHPTSASFTVNWNAGTVIGQFGADNTPQTYIGSVTAHDFIFLRGAAEKARVTTSGLSTPILTASTSVVTPLVGPTTAADLALQTNGTTRWLVSQAVGGGLVPNSDNAIALGLPANRISTIFTPIIDSGTTGSLSLKTNNGTTGFELNHTPSSVNWIRTQGAATGSGPFLGISVLSSDANVDLNLYSKGSGTVSVFTNTAADRQFQILHTASATRNITVTGSNGGNPTLNTTAGGIDISPATVRFPNLGTTAVAANATLNAVGSNDLLRSTSSQRYKKDWRNLEDADLDILDTIRTIKYKSSSEQDDPTLIHYGMLAEDVFKLNKNLVTFNKIDVGFDLDVPDWVQYERFIPLLIEQRRRDIKRIEALEAKLGIH